MLVSSRQQLEVAMLRENPISKLFLLKVYFCRILHSFKEGQIVYLFVFEGQKTIRQTSKCYKL